MDEAVRGQILWVRAADDGHESSGEFYIKVVGWTVAPFDGRAAALRHAHAQRLSRPAA